MKELIHHIPKCELHIHIEGTLEPELMMKLAKKNNISLPYKDVAQVEAAYHFKDLQSFLDIYYNGMAVLVDEQDFFDLTFAYLTKVSTQNVRIDHGDKCMQDPRLIEYLVKQQLPLTVCPISNLKLKVVKDLARHPIKHMVELGICATMNSDDPAYFGAYIEENFIQCNEVLHFSKQDIYQLAQNAIKASFLPEHAKQKLFAELTQKYDQYSQF